MKNKRTAKQVLISLMIVLAWVALALMTGTRRVSAATFTVTNTGDNGGVNPAPGAGTGTLRQAIVDANANCTRDSASVRVLLRSNDAHIGSSSSAPRIASHRRRRSVAGLCDSSDRRAAAKKGE